MFFHFMKKIQFLMFHTIHFLSTMNADFTMDSRMESFLNKSSTNSETTLYDKQFLEL